MIWVDEDRKRSCSRFYCPRCDRYIGDEYGPIGGCWPCDECLADEKKKPRKKT